MFLRQLSSKLIERGVSADTKRQAKISDLNGCRLDIGRHLDTGNCFRVNADPGNRVCGICNLPNILVDDAFDLQQGESYRSLLESKPTFLEGPGLVRVWYGRLPAGSFRWQGTPDVFCDGAIDDV